MPQADIYERQVLPQVGGVQPFEYQQPKASLLDFSAPMSAFAEVASKLQDDVDNSRVADSMNLLKKYAIDRRQGKNGFLKLLGKDATLPDDKGRGLAEREDQALHSYVDEISKDLTPRQRKLLSDKAIPLYDQQYAFATQHVMQQTLTFADGTNRNTIALSADTAQRCYDQPDVVKQCMDDVESAVDAYADRHGLSAEERKQKKLEAKAKVAVAAVNGALEACATDPTQIVFAREALNTYGRYMSASALTQLRDKVYAVEDKQYELATGKAGNNALRRDTGAMLVAMQSVVGGKLTGESSTWDPAITSVFSSGIIPQETGVIGGRQFDDDGNVLVGKYANGEMPPLEKRAYGRSQIQIGNAKYAAEEVLKEKFDERRFERDGDYNERLGRAFFKDLVIRYDGDLTKAVAAYHAGWPKVDKAIKRAEKAGKPDGWLDELHAMEGGDKGNGKYTTLGYVRSVMKRVEEARFGAVKDAKGRRINSFDPNAFRISHQGYGYREAERWVKANVPEVARNPERLKKYVDAVLEEQRRDDEQRKADSARLMAQVSDLIYAGEDIPPEVWSRMTGAQQQDAMELQKRVRAGDTSGDEALAMRYSTNSAAFLALAEDEMKAAVAAMPRAMQPKMRQTWYAGQTQASMEADKRAQARRDAAGGDTVWSQFAIKQSVVKGIVKSLPEFRNAKDEQINAMVHVLAKAAQQDQQTRFKKFTDDQELTDWVRQKLSKEFRTPGMFWGTNNKTIFDLKIGDLPFKTPNDVRPFYKELTIQRLEQSGITVPAEGPSDGQIMETFHLVQLMQSPPVNVEGMAVMDEETRAYYQGQFDQSLRKRKLPPRKMTDLELIRAWTRDRIENRAIPTGKKTKAAPPARTGTSAVRDATEETGATTIQEDED